MSNNLARFANDGLEIIVDTETNAPFATPGGYSRMTEGAVTKQTIQNRAKRLFEMATNSGIKQAQVPTTQGLRKATLIPASLCYEWSLVDCPELAEKMGEAGATAYMLHLAGYKIEAKAPTQRKLPQNYLEALEALVETEKARMVLEEKNEKLTPPALLGEQIETADNTISMQKYAAIVNIGRTTLFRILRKLDIIQQDNTIPYRRFIEEGYFEVTEVVRNEKVFASAQVTTKGQSYLTKRLVDAGYIDSDLID